MQQSTSQPSATFSIHRSYGAYIDGVQEFPEVQELKERTGSESATVEVMIGRGTSEEEFNDVLMLLKDDALVPKLGVVSITADKVAWTTSYSASKVQGHLPRNITTVVTVYDSNKRIQSTVVRYDEDLPSFNLATLPVDAIDATDTSVTDVFCDPGLHVLILQPPRNRSVFVLNAQAFQEELIHSLQMSTGLRKVSVPIDYDARINEAEMFQYVQPPPNRKNTSGQRALEVGTVASARKAGLRQDDPVTPLA
ncbi:hypothetical protein CPB84DRAFT_1849629 [Gymnopilus junonius]|uniref:Uncharacterized protein n=1 Tax=Gymnopilus junonius TaxID=109634 RepID=A0A9P5TKT0_GYMJU|nr:hypothetical protein CPB84DRAFT_1849629 [Gymnopilus junonius]